MNTTTAGPQDLERAKAQMKEAAQHAMGSPPPRDLNRAWKSVAMQFSLTFVTQHQAELQNAFDSGLRPQ